MKNEGEAKSMRKHEIMKAADLIGGEPNKLKTALQSLINTDAPAAPCVEPNALTAAYRLLEHYAVCRAIILLPIQERIRRGWVDIDYCEKVLNVAMELILVSAGGWETIR